MQPLGTRPGLAGHHLPIALPARISPVLYARRVWHRGADLHRLLRLSDDSRAAVLPLLRDGGCHNLAADPDIRQSRDHGGLLRRRDVCPVGGAEAAGMDHGQRVEGEERDSGRCVCAA